MRKTCADLVLLCPLAMAGVFSAAMSELARVEEPPHHGVTVRAQSVQELLPLIQYALKKVVITERWAEGEDDGAEDHGIAPFAMAKEGLSFRFLKKTKENAGVADEFLSTYRPSKEEAAKLSPDRLKCNADANIGCEALEQLGLPMYLLSLWPEDPAQRFHESSHQMAVCKLNDGCFLIVDHSVSTLWHGSLRSFVAQFGETCRMRLIPKVGIASYAEPVYRNWFSKLFSQALRGVADEEGMESLNLPMRRLSDVPLA